jgi:hypothetical protein
MGTFWDLLKARVLGRPVANVWICNGAVWRRVKFTPYWRLERL